MAGSSHLSFERWPSDAWVASLMIPMDLVLSIEVDLADEILHGVNSRFGRFRFAAEETCR